MTTPAKNITQTVLGGGKIRITQIRPYPTTFLGEFDAGSHAIGWVKDIRPASGNSTRVNNFKLCRPWDHSIEDFHLTPSTVSMRVYGGANNEQLWEFTEGSFWTSGITPLEPELSSNNMINWAMVKALNKIKEQDIHLGNFIAEFRQTAQMVAGAARSIAGQVSRFQVKYPKGWKTVKAVQTGRLPRHRWCEIPSAWLELQYGWIPLMSDVDGAIRHMYKTAKVGNPICTTTGVVKDDIQYDTVANGSLPSTATLHWNNERTAKVTLAYQVTNPTLHELSSLGLLNPLEIVWEVMKYSFVVDWFLPIGPWLSSLTGSAGTDFVTGTVTQFSKLTFRGSQVKETSINYVFDGKSEPQFKGSWILLKRTCLTTSPLPGLYVKNPMSALHVANAIALLAQVFRR
jgi:hypothetical protein